jgi:hypothetical protein
MSMDIASAQMRAKRWRPFNLGIWVSNAAWNRYHRTTKLTDENKSEFENTADANEFDAGMGNLGKTQTFCQDEEEASIDHCSSAELHNR